MKNLSFLLILFLLCACSREQAQQPVKGLGAFQYPLSDSLFTEVESLYRQAKESHNYVALEKYTSVLVRHYNDSRDYKPAFLFANDYLETITASGDSTLIPTAYYYVGLIYFNSGLPTYSIDYFLKMNDYPMDPKVECTMYYAIGENARSLVKSNGLNSMEYYQKAEVIARSVNDSLLIAFVLFGQSQLLFDSMGEYKSGSMSADKKDSLARSTLLLEDAVAGMVKNPNPVFIAALCLNYAAQGQYEKALSFRETIESFRHIPKFTSLTYNCMAAIGNYMKDYDEVIRLGKEAYAYAEENGMKFDRQHAAEIMAYAYKAKGDYQNALLNREIVFKIDEDKHNEESEMEMLALQVKYDLKIKEQTIVRQRTQLMWTVTITGLIVLALIVIIFFYRKKQQAYRDLVHKNQQWAETLWTEAPTPLNPDMNEIPVCANPECANPEEETVTDANSSSYDVKLMERIHSVMNECKRYKDPNLTLDRIADELQVNRNYISAAINHGTGKNLKTYLNEYRVKEAINLLSEKESNKYSIDGIAIESGFNDRHTFSRAFKNITGLSPATFRKNLQERKKEIQRSKQENS